MLSCQGTIYREPINHRCHYSCHPNNGRQKLYNIVRHINNPYILIMKIMLLSLKVNVHFYQTNTQKKKCMIYTILKQGIYILDAYINDQVCYEYLKFDILYAHMIQVTNFSCINFFHIFHERTGTRTKLRLYKLDLLNNKKMRPFIDVIISLLLCI